MNVEANIETYNCDQCRDTGLHDVDGMGVFVYCDCESGRQATLAGCSADPIDLPPHVWDLVEVGIIGGVSAGDTFLGRVCRVTCHDDQWVAEILTVQGKESHLVSSQEIAEKNKVLRCIHGEHNHAESEGNNV